MTSSVVTADVTGVAGVTKKRRSIILIPWDPDSPEHIHRMVKQRIACGWKQDYVEGWRDQQREGKIGLHWIVSIKVGSCLGSFSKHDCTPYADVQLIRSKGNTFVIFNVLSNQSPQIC